jgi:hypothetical protein
VEWRTDSFLSILLAANFARRAKNLRVVSFQESLPISDKPFTRHFGLEDPAIRDEAMIGEGAGQDGLYKASSILNEVLVGRKKVLGPNQLETLTTKARLAGLHLADRDSEKAQKEAQQVLKIVTGKEYRRAGIISTAVAWMCLSTLARCASSKAKELEVHPGQDKEMREQRKLAVSYSKQAAEAMEKTMGKQHPDTLSAVRMWAMAVLSTGNTKMVG